MAGAGFSICGVVGAVCLYVGHFAGSHVIGGTSTLACDALLTVIPVLTVMFTVTHKFNISAVVRRRFHGNFKNTARASSAVLRFMGSCLSRAGNKIFVKINLVVLL